MLNERMVPGSTVCCCILVKWHPDLQFLLNLEYGKHQREKEALGDTFLCDDLDNLENRSFWN